MEEQSLIRILAAEPKRKEFVIKAKDKEVKVAMRSLTPEEMDEAMTVSTRPDLVARDQAERVPILSYALLSINGVPIESYPEVVKLIEDKLTVRQAIRQVLSKMMGTSVINLLYAKYIQLISEERKEQEDAGNFF